MSTIRVAGLVALSVVATGVLIVAGMIGLVELGGRAVEP